MNYPTASNGVSTKDLTWLTVSSDEVLDLALRNKIFQVYEALKKYVKILTI